MKNILKLYFPLILTVLCTTFAIGFLFRAIPLFSSAFSDMTQTDTFTSVAEELETLPKSPLPTLKYVGNSLTVGDAIAFEPLFLLQFADGTTAYMQNNKQTAIYLFDVTSQNGSSVLSRFSADETLSLEELPSEAVYDNENHILYFRNSGIYTFYIHFYYDYHAGILYECQVPVEVR